MKKILFMWGLLCFIQTGQAQVINDPQAELREVKGFHAIRLSGSFDVHLTQGTEEVVAVSAADAESKSRIRTVVENGILSISFNGDKKFWKSWKQDKLQLKAYISVKQLKELEVSGACDVFVEGAFKADEMKMELSGASDVKMKGNFEAGTLKVELSGASDVEMNGKVSRMHIEASGASDFKGYDLQTDYCDAEASGASSIKITVNKELSAHASGASDVKYKGGGSVRESKSSGASTISRKS